MRRRLGVQFLVEQCVVGAHVACMSTSYHVLRDAPLRRRTFAAAATCRLQIVRATHRGKTKRRRAEGRGSKKPQLRGVSAKRRRCKKAATRTTASRRGIKSITSYEIDGARIAPLRASSHGGGEKKHCADFTAEITSFSLSSAIGGVPQCEPVRQRPRWKEPQ